MSGSQAYFVHIVNTSQSEAMLGNPPYGDTES